MAESQFAAEWPGSKISENQYVSQVKRKTGTVLFVGQQGRYIQDNLINFGGQSFWFMMSFSAHMDRRATALATRLVISVRLLGITRVAKAQMAQQVGNGLP